MTPSPCIPRIEKMVTAIFSMRLYGSCLVVPELVLFAIIIHTALASMSWPVYNGRPGSLQADNQLVSLLMRV
jgi:hypothetical protein